MSIVSLGQTLVQSLNGGAPLATAAWETRFEGTVQRYRPGMFFVGRHPESNELAGVGDNRHVLVVAGSRGDKGVSIIVPNLCLWPGSVVVIDPKGENAMVTARRRGSGNQYAHGMGQVVKILDPFDEVCTPDDDFADVKARFNPLSLLHANRPESVDVATRIADALATPGNAADPFWENSSRSLISGVMLHVATARDIPNDERNLVKVREFVVAGDMKAAQLAALRAGNKKPPTGHQLLFAAMKRNRAFGGVIAQYGEALQRLATNSPRLMESIATVAATHLDFLKSPGIARMVSGTDFDLTSLKTDAKGLSLYLCLPQRYMHTHHGWLRMMTTLIITEMEKVKQQPATGHHVLMLLDEFPALKRMPVIENAAAQIAGYGVKLVLVAQTLAQLKELYRDNWETFVANSGVKLFFSIGDHFTREYVSKLIGECEVLRYTRNINQTKGMSNSEASGSTQGWSQGTSWTSQFSDKSAGWSTTQSAGKSGGSSFTRTQGTTASQSAGYTETLHKRFLLTPDEVGREFGNAHDKKALVIPTGEQPSAVRRVAYFSDENFAGVHDWHRDYLRPRTTRAVQEARVRAIEDKRLLDLTTKCYAFERELGLAAERKRKKEEEVEKRRQREEDLKYFQAKFRYEVVFASGIGGIWLVSALVAVYQERYPLSLLFAVGFLLYCAVAVVMFIREYG